MIDDAVERPSPTILGATVVVSVEVPPVIVTV